MILLAVAAEVNCAYSQYEKKLDLPPGDQVSAELPISYDLLTNVHIQETAGRLTTAEKVLLIRLHQEMIPLPDTIKVVEPPEVRSHDLGWVSMWEPWTIYLTERRNDNPNVRDIPYGYLLGREPIKESPVPPQTSVLAHEIGHLLMPKVSGDLGRPAFGIQPATQEIQAEIVAYALMNIAFKTTREELGFPEMVEYAAEGLPDKSTEILRWQYCHIIKTQWTLTDLECPRTNDVSRVDAE